MIVLKSTKLCGPASLPYGAGLLIFTAIQGNGKMVRLQENTECRNTSTAEDYKNFLKETNG